MVESPPPAHARGHRVFRLLLLVAASVVVLLALVVAALQTPYARRIVVARAMNWVTSQGINVRADTLDYTLTPLSFSARNLRVVQRMDAAELVANIGEVHLDIDTLGLVHGQYVLKSGRAQDVSVRYVSNGPTIESSPSDFTIPSNVLVDYLEVTNAHVEYVDQSQELSLRLPIARAAVDGDRLTDRHLVRLESAGGTVDQGARHIALDRIDGEFSVGNNDAQIRSLQLNALNSRVAASGSLQRFSHPQLDITLTSQLDIPQLAGVVGVGDIAGNAQVTARVRGPVANLQVEAEMSGDGLAYRDLPPASLQATATYDGAGQRVRVAALSIDAPWTQVRANGAIALKETDVSQLTADISRLQVGTVAAVLAPEAAVASRVDANVSAHWNGTNIRAAVGEMTAQLSPESPATPRAIPVGGQLHVDANTQTVTATIKNLRAAGATAQGVVTLVERQRLGGRLYAQASDLPAAVRTAERALGRQPGTLLPTPVAGTIDVVATLAGTIETPAVSTQITAPALQVGTVPGINLVAVANYAGNAVTVPALDVTWADSHAHVDGRAVLTDPARLDFRVTADDVQLANVSAALNRPDVPISGSASVSGRVSGTVDRPIATFSLTGANLTAYQEPLGQLSFDADLDNQLVTINNLVLTKPQDDSVGVLWGSGAYALDSRTYTIALESNDLRVEHAALPGGTPMRGVVELSANGQGTVAQPGGTVNARMRDATWGPRELGDFNVDARIEGTQALIDAVNDRFKVKVNAQVGVTTPYPTTATATIDGLDLSTLPVQMPVPLTGTLRAKIEGSADLTQASAGTAAATIDAFEGSLNDQPIALPEPAHLTYQNERLQIESMRVAAGASTLAVSGELPLDAAGAPGAVSVTADLDLWSLPTYLPNMTEVSTYGRASLTGEIAGTLTSIEPTLTLTVENGMVQTWSMNAAVHDIALSSRVADGVASIDSMSATFGELGVMTATARVPLDVVYAPVALPHPGGPISAELHASDINPAMIPGAPEGLHGSIALDASLAAAEPTLAALSGIVEMPTIDVAIGSLAVAAAQPVRIAIADGLARIEQFSLSGSVGHLDVSGSSGLTGDSLNVDVDSGMNMAVISAFAPSIRSEGNLTATVAARGSARAPNLTGMVTIADALIGIDEPQIAAEHLAVTLNLDGPRATLTQLSGQLNGGDLTGAGTVVLGGDLPEINLQLSAADVALSTPLDMRSVSETHLQVHSEKDVIAVDGTITVKEAGLTGDINFDTGLLAAINARPTLDLTEQRNQLLDRMRFNVKVETEQPIVIDNNIAKAEVTSDLRVLGTPYEVGLSGRLDLSEGSVMTLTEHQYEVERGVITFVGERRIQPVFDLQLTTTASNYNITLAVSGQPGKTDTTLTSIPSLPEPDIMALLVTGRTLDEMRGEEFTVAREQVMSYLAGRLGSQLGQGIERATGLSEVRIEPNLIANEADPTARLTIGQDLAQNLKLVYSTNLSDSSDEIWVLTYEATRRFRTRAVRQSDGSYRSDFRHDVRFGGVPEPRRQKRQRPAVLAVTVPDASPLSRTELTRALRVKVGNSFDFLTLREGIDRVNRALLDKGYLQSRVSSQRETTAEGVRLSIAIDAGPVVEMIFEGITPSSRVRRELRQQWQRGVVDSQRLDDAIESIREWLLHARFMNPTIHGRINEEANAKRRVVFDIDRGRHFDALKVVFNGAQGVPADDLVRIVRDQRQEQKLYTDPALVVALLERYYHEQGYLTADIHTPRYEYQGGEARVVMDVIEGPRYTTRSIKAQGNTVMTSDSLVSDIPLLAGDVYRPAVAERSLERLRDIYWRRGYNDVVCDYVLTVDRRNGQVDVAFTISEGSQVVVSDIRVTGNEQTHESLVRGQLQVAAGQPLDLAALAQSRKNLYDTGAYSLVEVEQRSALPAAGEAPEVAVPAPSTPAPGDGSADVPPAAARPATTAAGDRDRDTGTASAPPALRTKPVDLDVTVREVQPYQLEYGVSYDTERGLGGILDVSDHNTLGSAREIGLRSRYDAQLHEARLYFTQPSLLTWKVKTALSAYTSREADPATSLSGAFTIDRIGASISQERELRNQYVWNYGVRYERAHTFDVSGARDERVKVSPMTSTFTRETRDDLLDARKGSFTSHSFAYAPRWLGTDAPYVKYFGQYFRYVPLQPEKRKPLTNEILKPRLVYAFGVRLGVARGLGSDVPASERFFAGGSTSLRGFEQNAVGPLGVGNVAAGGAASLIVNNELRFPLISIFDGVAFADTGNVYARASDFSLTNLRQTIGGGLRVRTKWFLIRGDYGFVLSPRPGESRSRAYVSIGQAF